MAAKAALQGTRQHTNPWPGVVLRDLLVDADPSNVMGWSAWTADTSFDDDIWDMKGLVGGRQVNFGGVPARWRSAVKLSILLDLKPNLANQLTDDPATRAAASTSNGIAPSTAQVKVSSIAGVLQELERVSGGAPIKPRHWTAIKEPLADRYSDPRGPAATVRQLHYRVHRLVDLGFPRPWGQKSIDTVFGRPNGNVTEASPTTVLPMLVACMVTIDTIAKDLLDRARFWHDSPDAYHALPVDCDPVSDDPFVAAGGQPATWLPDGHHLLPIHHNDRRVGEWSGGLPWWLERLVTASIYAVCGITGLRLRDVLTIPDEPVANTPDGPRLRWYQTKNQRDNIYERHLEMVPALADVIRLIFDLRTAIDAAPQTHTRYNIQPLFSKAINFNLRCTTEGEIYRPLDLIGSNNRPKMGGRLLQALELLQTPASSRPLTSCWRTHS